MANLSSVVFVQLDEQQSDACPDEFAHTYNQGHKDAGAGRHSQSAHRHEESALATAQLQGHEEQYVGKQRCESQDENTLHVVDARHENQQDEEHFQCRQDAAEQFQQHGGNERLGILLVQCRYLPVDGVELLAVLFNERLGPSFNEGQVAQQVHGSDGQSLAVAGNEEP